jgi:hypothetical protein
MSEQLSCPALVLLRDEDDETEKGQQQQEAGEDREKEACNSDTSSNGDIDDDRTPLRDNNESKGLPLAKQRQLSPSCDPAIRSSCKRRPQHSDDGISTIQPTQQQHQEIYREKESDHDHRDDQDGNNSEAPRPAKRRRLSPSSSNLTRRQRLQRPHVNDPTSKRTPKHHFQRPCERNTTPVQTQLEQSSSISNSDCRQSNVAPAPTSTGNQEPTSNTRAEYREWPIHGVFKRVIVGDEVRYGIEFSLEESRTRPQYRVSYQSTDGGDPQPDELWDIQRITGMRKVNGAEEFRVAWAQTWMPESELGGARELVEEFKARLSVQHGKKRGQGKPDVTGEKASKRQRGRPRKQV